MTTGNFVGKKSRQSPLVKVLVSMALWHGGTSESEIIGGARDERLFTHMITKATGHGISEKVAHRKQ